ncbi:SpoIIE family protein phosphatase [Streptomyces sp. NPDC051104]|uniref:ATP-binding SpoIIE family protein phosphatase n=1 Tax=Streptomyces sp. NPDC051104 TaxID=3155044 RepID=UPI00341DDA1A
MAATPRIDERVFALLVAYIALFSAAVVEISGAGHVRWALYAVFAPLVAAALLPFRLTLVIGVLSVLAVGLIYGVALPDVLPGGRVAVLVGVAVACGVGLAVCRVRLRLMIARRRLALLSDASERFGSTLDVTQTARDLAEVTVPRFADVVSVGVFESVLRGREPPTELPAEPVELRLVALQPVSPGVHRGALKPGEYPQVSFPARYLSACMPARAGYVDDVDVKGWLAQDPSLAALTTGEGDGYAAIAVPLCARGGVLGTVIFLRHRRPRSFDGDDLVLAEEMGSRAAVCLENARRYCRERETSRILQQNLLPRRMPELAAVEVASRYLPAQHGAGVGGDWFDVIPLSGARVALVVGDVVGHGLLASATMTRLRTAVRTLADIDLQPDELLTHLDDVVLRLSTESAPVDGGADLDVDGAAGEVGATCLYAIYDPVAGLCTLASAGHPPPAMVAPDGSTRVVDVPPGPLLGLGGLPFEAVDVQVPEGSLLVLYTDGLIRGNHRDPDSGLQELLHALSTPQPSLEGSCRAVLGTLLDGRPTDDVALLMARTRVLNSDHAATWDLRADPAVVAEAREQAARQLAAWRLHDAAFTTELIVSELVTNAIRYAQPPVRLSLIHEDHSLICEVSDGSTTTPHLRRARTFEEGGRGLFIVAQLARRWGTRHSRHGKTIWAELAAGDGPDSGAA